MDWNLFWEAFGAIGGTIGALATAAAVIVALWQTKYSYRKKLKISFSENIIVSSGIDIHCQCVGVTIVNIGNRDVIIKNWGFDLDDEAKIVIIPDFSLVGRTIQVSLPHKLQVEESMDLYYEKNLFYNVLEKSIREGSLKKNRKIRFFVNDSTGKKHYVKTKNTAEVILSNRTKQIR